MAAFGKQLGAALRKPAGQNFPLSNKTAKNPFAKPAMPASKGVKMPMLGARPPAGVSGLTPPGIPTGLPPTAASNKIKDLAKSTAGLLGNPTATPSASTPSGAVEDTDALEPTTTPSAGTENQQNTEGGGQKPDNASVIRPEDADLETQQEEGKCVGISARNAAVLAGASDVGNGSEIADKHGIGPEGASIETGAAILEEATGNQAETGQMSGEEIVQKAQEENKVGVIGYEGHARTIIPDPDDPNAVLEIDPNNPQDYVKLTAADLNERGGGAIDTALVERLTGKKATA